MKIIKYLLSGLIAFFLSFLLISFSIEKPETYDLLIKNARIIDGSGGETFYGNIGIKGEKIVRIDKMELKEKAAVIFDGQGFTLAPAKVDWPLKEEWVERDLTSALKRYPPERLIIKEAITEKWIGKSVQELMDKEPEDLLKLTQDKRTKVVIVPLFKEPEVDTVEQGFYRLTGWRGEMLEEKVGKIQEGFPAKLIIFNHRQLSERELLGYLLIEKMPPVDFYIEDGKVVQSTKTSS